MNDYNTFRKGWNNFKKCFRENKRSYTIWGIIGGIVYSLISLLSWPILDKTNSSVIRNVILYPYFYASDLIGTYWWDFNFTPTVTYYLTVGLAIPIGFILGILSSSFIKHLIKNWQTYFERSKIFIKKVSSNVFVRAALFGLCFPYLLSYFLYLILKPFGFNSKTIALIPISFGIYFTSLLERIGLIHIPNSHGGMGVLFGFGFLFSMILYFLLYLVVHYIQLKK